MLISKQRRGLKARPQARALAWHFTSCLWPRKAILCLGVGLNLQLGSVTWNLQTFFYSLPDPKLKWLESRSL